ncbi:DDE-type integrase/transposase/recombinase, partial [Staphylococcus saprophyticus]|uniref:DDE-type integrase/transposase/recombinase n=1 Tax=Staphylococcus saprophyticus TaxID=29385 RepID=UPI001642F5D2
IFYQISNKKHKKPYYKSPIQHTYIKIKRKSTYLYPPIHPHRHTLHISFPNQPHNHSPYPFIKPLIKQFPKPQNLITHHPPSTNLPIPKLIKPFKLKPHSHSTSKYLNNLIHQHHPHIKLTNTTYQTINTPNNTLKPIQSIYPLYKNNPTSLHIYPFSPSHQITIILPT